MNRREALKTLLSIGVVGFTAPLVCAKSGIPSDWHSHKCYNSRCGKIWSHGEGVTISHNCPSCGIFQNIILEGSISRIQINSLNPYPPNFQIAPKEIEKPKPIVKPSLKRSNFGIFGQGQLKY